MLNNKMWDRNEIDERRRKTAAMGNQFGDNNQTKIFHSNIFLLCGWQQWRRCIAGMCNIWYDCSKVSFKSQFSCTPSFIDFNSLHLIIQQMSKVLNSDISSFHRRSENCMQNWPLMKFFHCRYLKYLVFVPQSHFTS